VDTNTGSVTYTNWLGKVRTSTGNITSYNPSGSGSTGFTTNSGCQACA
jgi:hypothetical protein